MYLAHHNGKLNRFKVRFRKYVISKLCFLEIKYKLKGIRTVKYRTMVPEPEYMLSPESIEYIERYTPFKGSLLKPQIHTDFTRITLVNKQLTERVTIDLDLCFRQNGNPFTMGNVAIIELKRDGMAGNSHLIEALNYYGVFPKGFSKYCIGRALLEKDIKKNNFKERILTINKIHNGKYYYRNFS
jgi:hypothetical protein